MATSDNLFTRIRDALSSFGIWPKTNIKPVPVGLEGDGLVPASPGSAYDRSWGEILDNIENAREAWQKNTLARRVVSIVTVYTVGDGIMPTVSYVPDSELSETDVTELSKFISVFWEINNMDFRISSWSDEFGISGEIFPVIFFDREGSMPSVRAVPAAEIREVIWLSDGDFEDYETEIAYRENLRSGQTEARVWQAPDYLSDDATATMLHFAVNRPLGALRGDGDLSPILPWIRRYTGFLKDRVRLNSNANRFLWIVYASRKRLEEIRKKKLYSSPPSDGSVVFSEDGAERWESLTPNISASSAVDDGREVRRMIVNGGPGISLMDIGDPEDSNRSSGQVMVELRRRFLLRRQRVLIDVVREVVSEAYFRYSGNAIPANLIDVQAPDIAPEDNSGLTESGSAFITSAIGLQGIVGLSDPLKEFVLSTYSKLIGEPFSQADIESIIADGVFPEVAVAMDDRPKDPKGKGSKDPKGKDNKKDESK